MLICVLFIRAFYRKMRAAIVCLLFSVLLCEIGAQDKFHLEMNDSIVEFHCEIKLSGDESSESELQNNNSSSPKRTMICQSASNGSPISQIEITNRQYALNGNMNTTTTTIVFVASNNQLQQIPKSLFKSMPKLNRVYFSFNQLQSLMSQDFNGAVQLTTIICNNNEIKTIEPGTFAQQKSLEYINLSCNRIQALDKGLFVENAKLNVLLLRDNPLKEFHSNIFSPLASSISLFLPSDSVETIDLQYENSNCPLNITFFDGPFEKVGKFSCSGLEFERILQLMEKLGAQLQYLDLSNLTIGHISRTWLEKFSNLKVISLSNAGISTIEPGSFDNQVALTSLDLSCNHLQSIDNVFKTKFTDLKTVNFNDNNLTTIDETTWNYWPHLSRLGIKGDQFDDGFLAKYLNGRNGIKMIEDSACR